MQPRELQGGVGPHAPAHDHRPRLARRVQHGPQIAGESAPEVVVVVARDVGGRIAAGVRDDAAEPGGKGLHLTAPLPPIRAELVCEQQGRARAGLFEPELRPVACRCAGHRSSLYSLPSSAGLFRRSINTGGAPRTWVAGTSPAMTVVLFGSTPPARPPAPDSRCSPARPRRRRRSCCR